ncbi:MAG: DUF4837 family protein [Ignavibacteriae bacterium]|nr:DUF4837 family protein [Ignavibacteriota bacterium]
MKTKITFLTILILSIFIFTSCESKRKAKGQEDEIIVIADSAEFVQLESTLKNVFGKLIYTPQPEQLFRLNRRDISFISKLKRAKNIIILAPLNSNSKVSEFINNSLDQNVKDLVLTDSVFVINKYDLWSTGQLTMFLTAKDLEMLNLKLLENKDDLLFYFKDISNKRLAKGLYNNRFEQKDIEAKLLSDHGWMMYVQADYKLAINKPEDNFVWLRRGVNTNMERWIFVHWIEDATPEFLNKDSIAAKRDEITKKFYTTADDKAYVDHYDDYKMTKEVNYNDKYAIMTQGLWRFNDQSGGGPFVNYTFYDEDTKRIYMLDASIFAPKYLKKNLLQQVDVLLHSFKTEKEIDPERKKEILESLETDEK